MTEMKVSPELKALNVESVADYLTNHPAVAANKDGSRAYEVAIVQLIDRNPWDSNSILTVMTQLIDQYAQNPDLAYAAYYGLCTYYRRNRSVKEYNNLIKSPKGDFETRPSYVFLALMCDKMLNPKDWRILRRAEKLCGMEGLKDNYGVKHCFAEYVAEACENDPSRVSYFIKEYMDSAIRRVDEAIAESGDSYAKFYVTRARLNNIKAIYTEDESCFRLSQSEIEEAISKEDDSAKRNDYNSIGVQLRSEYYAKTLAKQISDQEASIQKQFHENNVKNLEFLSFFSAIIGLLIAGIQVTLNMDFRQAATLLVALSGCLITAFGAIGFVLHSKWQRWIVNLVIVMIGALLLISAMLYGAKHAL